MTESLRLTPSRSLHIEVLVWIGVAACAAGIVATGLWRQLPLGRFGESLLIAGLVALLAWPLRRWRGGSWATSLAAVWLLALVALTGIAPMLAVLLMIVAALAIGSLVIGATQPLLALLAGFSCIAAVLGWLLPMPVHYGWTYGPLLLVVAWARRDALRVQVLACIDGWTSAVSVCPRIAAWSVVLLGIASTGAWMPTMQFDDLAYHLGIPWQLMLHGRYALDVSQQVWALAPWAGDVLQAVPQVLARTEARSALNLAWLAATATGLWQLGARLGLSPALRWAAPALFASLPMTAALLGGMQTETAGAALLVGLALTILDDHAAAGTRRLFTGALLFGLLCALKPWHAISALPLLAWAGWRARRALPGVVPLACAALLVLAVGGPSYAYAWLTSGNPVLPLFNATFRSPAFAPADLGDARWHAGFGADIVWQLTFDTDRFVEGWDGALGLLLVALSGAWIVALFRPATRALAICATLAILAPLVPLQYARYVHPGLVLLLPALAASLQGLPARRTIALLATLCAANVVLQANAGWLLHLGGIKRSVTALGADEPLLRRYAPERVLAAQIRRQAPGTGPVLLLSQPFQAEFAGRGRDIAWYAPRMQAAALEAEADPTGAAWATLLRREGIAEVILDPATATAAQRAGLARIGARREATAGNAEWWRIPATEDRT